MSKHAISEELTLYPSMEKYLGKEGVELADVDREQHMAVSFLRGLKHGTALTCNR